MSHFCEGDRVKAVRVTKNGVMQPEPWAVGQVGTIRSCHTMGGEAFYEVQFGHLSDNIDEICLERVL